MILKKLLIENIRSYDKQEIIFPRGSTLLSGDIGSGKTTVLLAVEFALFGLEPGQKATSLLSNGKDEARVVLDFGLEEKEMSRQRRPTRRSISRKGYGSNATAAKRLFTGKR